MKPRIASIALISVIVKSAMIVIDRIIVIGNFDYLTFFIIGSQLRLHLEMRSAYSMLYTVQ